MILPTKNESYSWLRLIRWKNLIIILFTQFLAWWCIILPCSPIVLSPVNFILLAISTALIAAAGYMINDYFDIKIDLVNKPEKVVLETTIPRKKAIIFHTLLNVCGLLLAAYVALRANHPEWVLLQALCTLLLWFYSTHFKRQFLTGNVVVSLLTALTILALVIYEPAISSFQSFKFYPSPAMVLIVYALFAFALTLMREIVKDMEDHIGDASEGCKTLPVIKGLNYAGNIVMVIECIIIAPLAYIAYLLFTQGLHILSSYIVLLIALLVAWAAFLKNGKTDPGHYHHSSTGLKIIMLAGVLSLLIYHFQMS
jgi:4-hydroxybenzoate polyprenyltransferase